MKLLAHEKPMKNAFKHEIFGGGYNREWQLMARLRWAELQRVKNLSSDLLKLQTEFLLNLKYEVKLIQKDVPHIHFKKKRLIFIFTYVVHKKYWSLNVQSLTDGVKTRWLLSHGC